MTQHLTPAAVALGLGLRAARTHREIGVRALATALDIEPAVVSTVELATRRPKIEYVIHVLGFLSVTGAEFHRLVELARHVTDPNWLESGPVEYPALRLEYEQAATTITEWAPVTVPEPVQTPDYARALLHAGMLTGDEVDGGVMLRLARSATPGTANTTYTVLLGDPALQHRFGTAFALREQLRHLLDLAGQRRIDVRVVPTAGDWHPTMIAPFAVYEFEKRLPLVTLAHHYADAYLTEQAPVARYRTSMEHLMAKRALGADDSRERITAALTSLG
ncbi:DUF5753 domain-containing protein [Amycolatopsis samaneae]|uniref:DUF5753 domain-containing protein n=1 Tax=Amycolatopsis samaneae TaxID=664691 RepID=A0ABW5GH42_9PSEU